MATNLKIADEAELRPIGQAIVGAGTVAVVEQLAVKLSPRNKVLVMVAFAALAYWILVVWRNREN